MKVLHWIALILVIIGALNWGMVGFFNIDVISGIFGFGSVTSRIIFAIVGLAGLWSFSFFKLINDWCDKCHTRGHDHTTHTNNHNHKV